MPKRRKKAARRLKYPKKLQYLDTNNIALYFGVSPATVRRWKSKGIPLARKEALGAFAPLPIAKEQRSALKLAPEALASVAGVTLATAKRWKRAGAIPPRSRGFLAASGPKEAAPVVRLKPSQSTSNYSGRFTTGYVVQWDYPEAGQELDETSIRDILDKVATGKKYRSPGLSYQAAFEVQSELAPTDRIQQAYQVAVMNGGSTPLIITSTANASVSDLVAECSQLLHDASRFLTRCQSFRLIVRRKKDAL